MESLFKQQRQYEQPQFAKLFPQKEISSLFLSLNRIFRDTERKSDVSDFFFHLHFVREFLFVVPADGKWPDRNGRWLPLQSLLQLLPLQTRRSASSIFHEACEPVAGHEENLKKHDKQNDKDKK